MIWKFKKDLKPVSLDCRLHDAMDDGYVHPEDLLEDKEQVNKVIEAMNIIQSLEAHMIKNGLIREY